MIPLNPLQLEHFVIRPTLAHIGQDLDGFAGDAAAELLLGTAAHESGGFAFIDQRTGPGDLRLGPAVGLFQIEPATHDDIRENFLRSRPGIEKRVKDLLAPWPAPDVQLATNLAYAVAIARLIYWRAPAPLAMPGDIPGHAALWKRIYNTAAGKGREAQFIDAWRRHVAPFRKG